MAKESMKARQAKRLKLVAKYAAKRAELKKAGDYEGLQALPKNASPVRLHNICNNCLSNQPGKGFGFVVNKHVRSTYNTHRDNRTYLVDFPVSDN